MRAGATASGATGAWAVARLTGTPTRARTVGLAALVGTQLGQTLVAGGKSPLVIGATAVSVGALVTVVQTPGVSQFFGCRPMGPVGWSTAIGAADHGHRRIRGRAVGDRTRGTGHRLDRRSRPSATPVPRSSPVETPGGPMNLVPVAVAGAVIVAVPPLRRRVVSVTAAVYEGTSDVIVTTARSARDVAVAAIDGVVGVGTVALKGTPKPEGDGRLATQ